MKKDYKIKIIIFTGLLMSLSCFSQSGLLMFNTEVVDEINVGDETDDEDVSLLESKGIGQIAVYSITSAVELGFGKYALYMTRVNPHRFTRNLSKRFGIVVLASLISRLLLLVSGSDLKTIKKLKRHKLLAKLGFAYGVFLTIRHTKRVDSAEREFLEYNFNDRNRLYELEIDEDEVDIDSIKELDRVENE